MKYEDVIIKHKQSGIEFNLTINREDNTTSIIEEDWIILNQSVIADEKHNLNLKNVTLEVNNVKNKLKVGNKVKIIVTPDGCMKNLVGHIGRIKRINPYNDYPYRISYIYPGLDLNCKASDLELVPEEKPKKPKIKVGDAFMWLGEDGHLWDKGGIYLVAEINEGNIFISHKSGALKHQESIILNHFYIETTWKKIKLMSFSKALKHMKAGKRIARLDDQSSIWYMKDNNAILNTLVNEPGTVRVMRIDEILANDWYVVE